jgi:DNA repair protein RadD
MTERREIKRQFHNGEIKVVCNVGTLTTGVDWDVRCIIFARPTKSKMLFVQIAGRGLRTAPTARTTACSWTTATTICGLASSPTSMSTSSTMARPQNVETRQDRALPKKCPQCAFLKAPRTAVCPNCGFKAEIVSQVEVQEGQLKELQKTPKAKGKFDDTFDGKCEIHGQLLNYAATKGYSQGWASHKFREIYGHWPDGSGAGIWNPPTPALLSWIKHTQIRYAKRRRAETTHTVAEVA